MPFITLNLLVLQLQENETIAQEKSGYRPLLSTLSTTRRLTDPKISVQLKWPNTQQSGHMGTTFPNWINGWNMFWQSS